MEMSFDLLEEIEKLEKNIINYQEYEMLKKDILNLIEYESQTLKDNKEDITMTFEKALSLLKEGKKIRRAVWQENMFIARQKAYPDGIMPNEQTQEAWNLKPDELFKCKPYLQIKNADGSHSMYTPTNEDLLESDWSLI